MNRFLKLAVSHAFLAFFSCALSFSQAVSAGDVRVESAGGKLLLQVAKASSVSSILDEFCRQTAAQCDGTAAASAIMASPQQISGSWEQIVSRLLEGSKLNYVVSSSGVAGTGRLLVQGMAAELSSGPNANRMQMENQVQAGSVAGGMAAQNSAITESPEPAQSAEASPQPDAGAPATSNPYTGAAMGERSDSGLGAYAGGGTSSAGMGNFLPFPDSHGNPIPATSGESPYLPFPDSQGNPIPVRNEPNTFLPFPDSNGNPIPVKNEASPYLPFPDSHGNPIPTRPEPR